MALTDTPRASFWTLLICGWICCVHGGNVEVLEGEPVTLKCAHAAEETDIFWKKLESGKWKTVISRLDKTENALRPQSSPLKNNTVSLSEDGSLIIQTASYPTTNGTFIFVSKGQMCEVSLLVYQKMQSLDIEVLPDTILENSEVSVTCEVKGGNPQPDIIWEIPETFHISSEEKSSTHRSKVTLTVTKDDNNKEIGCKASNPNQTLIKKYRFNIKYKPAVHIRTLGKKLFYTEGETDTLICTAKGNPKPEITWMHGGYPLRGATTANENQYGDTDGEAVVQFVTVTFDPNNRSYSCAATNTMGTTEAILTLSVFDLAIVAVAGTVGAAGLAVLIGGMWFCFTHCKPKLSQLNAVCRQEKRNRDIDVDSEGYSQIPIASFFESNRQQSTGSIGDAQSCRTSDTSAAVGDHDTDETVHDEAVFATTSMNRHDSSEYLHARSTPTSSAAGQDFGARPKQSTAEVHYLPMDGSVKLKTRRKDTEKRGAKPKMNTYGGRRRGLGASDSFNPVVYANQTRNTIETADDIPKDTDFDLSGIIDSPEFSSQSAVDTQNERKVYKKTGRIGRIGDPSWLPARNDSRKYLPARRIPLSGVAGQDTGARPEQFEVAAEVHYLPMDGSAKLKPRRKETERGEAKPKKSLILSDGFNPAVYAKQQKIEIESVGYVPQEADFDLSGIVDSPEFASQSPGDAKTSRIMYDKTGDIRPIDDPCWVPSRSNTI